MPNYYAHLIFGDLVLAHLPRPLGRELLWEQVAFQLGLFGPDPLFFGPGHCRGTGIEVHNEPPDALAERLRELTAPALQSYGAGVMCHLMLDGRCHPWINGEGKAMGLSHGGIEAELDRLLMEGQQDRDLLPHISLPEAFYQGAAALYPGVSAGELKTSLRRFLGVCRLQRRLTGLPLRPITERFSLTRGAILPPVPQPEYRAAAEVLQGMLREEVSGCAKALEGLYCPSSQRQAAVAATEPSAAAVVS